MTVLRRLRVRFSDEQSDLEVLLADGADVHSLAEVLGSNASELTVDGHTVAGELSLEDAAVVDGSIVDLDAASRSGSPPDGTSVGSVAVVDQIAGMPGARYRSLRPGRAHIGSVEVDVSPDGSIVVRPGPSPVVVDDETVTEPTSLSEHVLNLGSARYVARRPGSLASPHRRAPVSISRHVSPPALPVLSEPRRPVMAIALLALAVILGIVGVVAHPAFLIAAFASIAFACVLLIDRMSARTREERSHHNETEALIAAFEHEVRAERHSVEAGLRAIEPSIAELTHAAEHDGSSYRGRSHVDRVAIAYGDVDWQILTDSDRDLPSRLQQVVDSNDKLLSIPIPVDLSRGTLGLVGERERTLACARALILRLAAFSAPEDLRVWLAAEQRQLPDWDWIKWLPHSNAAVAVSPDAAERLAHRLSASSATTSVLILDQPKWMIEDSALAGARNVVALASEIDELSYCSTILELDSSGTARLSTDGRPASDLLTPICASVNVADEFARLLAKTTQSTIDPVDSRVGVRPFHLEPGRFDVPVPPPVPTRPTTRWSRLRGRR